MSFQTGNKPCCDKPLYAKGLCKFHYNKQWKIINKERHSEINKAYYWRNHGIALLNGREAAKRFRQRHPWKINALASSTRAKKRRATPKWSETNLINQFYKDCPVGYQVDHIYPLNSKIVCGLHVLSNLQYLTPEANKRKSNSCPA